MPVPKPAALVLSMLTVTTAFAAPVDRCDQIVSYESSPNISGNTVASFGNQYDLNACAGQPGAALLTASGQANEQVVKVRVANACTATVTVVGGFSGGNQSDPAIYAATTCPIAPANTTQFLDNTCLAAADATGGLGTEVISFSAQPETDYFLYFDGFLAALGPYTATISGCTLIDPSLEPLFVNGFEG